MPCFGPWELLSIPMKAYSPWFFCFLGDSGVRPESANDHPSGWNPRHIPIGCASSQGNSSKWEASVHKGPLSSFPFIACLCWENLILSHITYLYHRLGSVWLKVSQYCGRPSFLTAGDNEILCFLLLILEVTLWIMKSTSSASTLGVPLVSTVKKYSNPRELPQDFSTKGILVCTTFGTGITTEVLTMDFWFGKYLK